MKFLTFYYISIVYFIENGKLEHIPIEERIIGGKEISITEYPYQLSLRYYDEHYCGATLISKLVAITAAHCVTNSYKHYSIQAGSSTLDSNGTVVRISRIIRHPKYNPITLDYDAAIIIFKRYLLYGPNINIIKLADANKIVPVGTQAVATGWGVTESDGMVLSRNLRSVTVLTMSQGLCKINYGIAAITSRMMCAGDIHGGKDACMGDSGGPLVANNQLIGITSWGIGCGDPMYPGVYTKVSKVRSFVRKYTRI